MSQDVTVYHSIQNSDKACSTDIHQALLVNHLHVAFTGLSDGLCASLLSHLPGEGAQLDCSHMSMIRSASIELPYSAGLHCWMCRTIP